MVTRDALPPLHEHVAVEGSRLAARHAGRFSSETMRALTTDSCQRLAATASVTARLAVLAERLIETRLSGLPAFPAPSSTRSESE